MLKSCSLWLLSLTLLWCVRLPSYASEVDGDLSLQPFAVSVTGLVLDKTPSDQALMSAGQLGGALYPTNYDVLPTKVAKLVAATVAWASLSSNLHD